MFVRTQIFACRCGSSLRRQQKEEVELFWDVLMPKVLWVVRHWLSCVLSIDHPVKTTARSIHHNDPK